MNGWKAWGLLFGGGPVAHLTGKEIKVHNISISSPNFLTF